MLDTFLAQLPIWVISIVVTLIFAWTYYSRTWKNRNERELFYFESEDGERYFDFSFLKKVIFQLITIFLTSFSFANVFYFCVNGAWITAGTFGVTRGFLILGSLIYFFDLIEKSMGIIRDERKKRRAQKPENLPPQNSPKGDALTTELPGTEKP
jgi:hypothetical protein